MTNKPTWHLGLIGVLMLLIAGCAPAATPEPTSSPTIEPTDTVVPTPAITPVALARSFECGASMIEQPFERGRMFWISRSTDDRCDSTPDFTPGNGEIWVLFFDPGVETGTWVSFVDDWDENTDVESDPLMIPPEGLLQPVRGFGDVWRNKLSASERNAIGWAVLAEWPFTSEYEWQAAGFENSEGEWVPRGGVHVFTDLGGNQFRMDETNHTFQFIVTEPTPTVEPTATPTPEGTPGAAPEGGTGTPGEITGTPGAEETATPED